MRTISFTEALNECLEQTMGLDPDVVLFGESIGDGDGIYGVTRGLLQRFGEGRVVDTPISEGGFSAMGVAAAMAGLRPVVEIMHVDFLFVGADALVNQAPKYHYISGGQFRVPIVFRMAYGLGEFPGGGAMQFQSLHAMFLGLPGLKVVLPSNPADAKGLLHASILDDDPVVFFEDKKLYSRTGPVPEALFTVPLGHAAVLREGSDVTIVATGSRVEVACHVSDGLRGLASVEVIDPRTLRPLDEAALVASARKTGRVLVFDEGHRTGGFAGEVAAVIAEACPEALRAFRRVMAPDVPVPYSPPLATAMVPGAMDLRAAITAVLKAT